MDELISDISRGKASLSVPEKHTVPEIMSNGSLVRRLFNYFCSIWVLFLCNQLF